MKPSPFQYHRADTLSDAASMLASLENTRLLSGGQSLMPMMNMRFVMVDHLIDLNPVSELAGIDFDGDCLQVGGMTRQRLMLESDEIATRAPVIREALSFVGHIQTRNRGTVGGSLAHMDPAAELMGLAALMDAKITLASVHGERQVASADYPLSYMTPNIEPDEILTKVTFDLWPDGHGWDFREFAQRHGDFAIVGVGSLLSLGSNGRIDRAAVVLIGVGDGPLRLDDVEAALLGEAPDAEVFQAAGALAAKRELMADALVTSAYRQKLANVLVRRSLTRAAERAEEGVNV